MSAVIKPLWKERPMSELVWTCEKCGDPVEDHAGSIHIDPSEALAVGGARRELERTHPEGAWSIQDLLALPGPVVWEVHHGRCEPDPERSVYWIGVERARSHAQLLDWTAHLMGKTWLRDTTWEDVIRTASKVST